MSEIIVKNLTSEQKNTLRYVARLIMKGSKGREQIHGRYFYKHVEDALPPGCCALGACLLAVGALEGDSIVLNDWLNTNYWPEINYPENTPAWEQWNDALYYGSDRVRKPMRLVDVIMQLNDAAHWSFRRIAAYLRLVAQRGVVITTSA